MSWLGRIPIGLTVPLFGLAFGALAVLAHWLFRLFVPSERLSGHNDVAAALVSVVGVLYSVVLGFLVGTVWTSFDTAQQTADQEARYVENAFSFASELPEPVGTRVQSRIAQYAIEVRNVEWTDLSHGQSDPRARALLNDAIQKALAISAPANAQPGEVLKVESVVDATVENLRSVANNRAMRLAQARDRLPFAVFEALVLGALAVITFVFLFGVKPIVLQMTMTAIVAGCIGLFFGLIVDLNAPYAGPIRVSPDAWTSMIQSSHFDSFALPG